MPIPSGRRGDLDALRSFAMLLGIVVHASLAYFPIPWPVQDPRQARLFGILFAAIHGFRMPLFFLLSGFFTMLVLRRSGVRGLLAQRTLRILLPLAAAMATILPLDWAVISLAIQRGTASVGSRSPLIGGILAGDGNAVASALAAGSSASAVDPVSGVTPLGYAAMRGDAGIVRSLLAAGAAVDERNRDGSTPLHGAAFMGTAEVAELLLAHGADPVARNSAGKTPLDAMDYPPDLAVLAGRFLGTPERDVRDLTSGRAQVSMLLAARTATARRSARAALTAGYRAWISSPALRVDLFGRSWHLFMTDLFDHLWFLWYLCWLVASLALAEIVHVAPTGRLRWWLVPASCVPYAFMSFPYGPDTAIGLLPMPHLLLFYWCFFWFGAATFAAEGTATALGRHWRATLPLALVILFPVGLATLGTASLAATLQPAYAWAMSLGLIGLFHSVFSRPSPPIRWLADAAFWMYLAHVPVVILAQTLLVDLPWPAAAKFAAVVAATLVLLLATYRWCVRFTPIGWLLNGPRAPEGQTNPRLS